MELFAALTFLALGVAALYVSARRAITVAEIDVSEGKVRVVRGGIAPSVLAELQDVVERPRVVHARLRITRADGLAALTIEGDVAPAQAQRLRNVVGSVPLARLVNARRKR